MRIFKELSNGSSFWRKSNMQIFQLYSLPNCLPCQFQKNRKLTMEQCKQTWPYWLMSIKNAIAGGFKISKSDTQKCIVHLQPMSHKGWLHFGQSLGATTFSNLRNTYKASLNTPSVYVCSCLEVILFSLSFNPTLTWNSTITNLIEETHRQQIWFSQLAENMKGRYSNLTLPKICTSTVNVPPQLPQQSWKLGGKNYVGHYTWQEEMDKVRKNTTKLYTIVCLS